MGWEYRMEWVGFERIPSLDELNAWGRDGWELVTIEHGLLYDGHGRRNAALLKRHMPGHPYRDDGGAT